MAIEINDNTVTGDIYYNGDKVQAVYINGELAWEALPGNNITLEIRRRVMGGVDQFRVVLTAEHPVKKDITVNVRYNTGAGDSTTVTIYADDRYGLTGWREGYANLAVITGVSPQGDGTYRYTYTSPGVISEGGISIFSSLITAAATMTYNPPSAPVERIFVIRVESQYRVENWSVDAEFSLGPTLLTVTLQNTKSKTQTETGRTAARCEWRTLSYPPSSETGYYYVEGPVTFQVIDNRT